MTTDLNRDEQKAVFKEAIKEWMDEQFAAFGRWAFYSLLVAAFVGMVYLAMIGQGWKK